MSERREGGREERDFYHIFLPQNYANINYQKFEHYNSMQLHCEIINVVHECRLPLMGLLLDISDTIKPGGS